MKNVLFSLALCFAVLPYSKAQDVRLLSLDQMEQRFSKGGDTLYVVNFWATWCAPCIEELPYFDKLQSAYPKSPLKVMLVSLDFKSKLETGVKPFVKRSKLSSEIFLLNESNQQEFIDRIDKNWSGALPATLFINNNKKIRKFDQKEFKYEELEKTYQLLK